mmetsp:Transcript_15890/g.31702  ORF Transcript_15890/g.31702 Transcript_15890/m.31702 type:complete len:212 (-) Transcript_15890:1105-1740(-)
MEAIRDAGINVRRNAANTPITRTSARTGDVESVLLIDMNCPFIPGVLAEELSLFLLLRDDLLPNACSSSSSSARIDFRINGVLKGCRPAPMLVSAESSSSAIMPRSEYGGGGGGVSADNNSCLAIEYLSAWLFPAKIISDNAIPVTAAAIVPPKDAYGAQNEKISSSARRSIGLPKFTCSRRGFRSTVGGSKVNCSFDEADITLDPPPILL